MKPTISLILLCCVFIIPPGCVGRLARERPPAHLSYATKQMEKGLGWYQKGCYAYAQSFFLKAHERFSSLDQQSGVAMSLNNLANVERIIGDMAAAHLFYDKAIDIFKSRSDHSSQVRVLTNKAAAYISNNELEDARIILDMASVIAKQHRINSVWINNHWGVLFTRQKKYDRAALHLKKAFSQTDEEQLSQIANVNFAMGNLMFEMGKLNEAIPFFQRALHADQKQGFYEGIAGDLKRIGDVCIKLSQWNDAFIHFERSIKIYALIGNNKKVSELIESIEDMKSRQIPPFDVTAYFIHQWIKESPLDPVCPK